MNIKHHPLTQLLMKYCEEYPDCKDQHLDLPNQAFHQQFGLAIQVPSSWPVLESMKHVLEANSFQRSKTAIIFSTIADYQNLHEAFGGDDIQYFSWHELFSGLHLANTDIRHIRKVKNMLTEASYVFFLDPPEAISTVLEHVRGFTNGCLVILGGVRGE